LKFNLSKKKSLNIIKDSISSSLGFGTKKERMDFALDYYKRNDINQLNSNIANRNILLSQLKTKIDIFNTLIESYDKFINFYDKIVEISENEIKKGNSNVYFKLKKRDGSLVEGNYKSLNILITNLDDKDIISLSKQLDNLLESVTYSLADALIRSKGLIYIEGKKIEEFEIYQNFVLAKNMLNLGQIKGINQQILINDINNFYDLKKAREIILDYKRNIELLYQDFLYRYSVITKISENDENALKLIEDTKNAIKASEEYYIATSSHEYLEEIKRIK